MTAFVIVMGICPQLVLRGAIAKISTMRCPPRPFCTGFGLKVAKDVLGLLAHLRTHRGIAKHAKQQAS